MEDASIIALYWQRDEEALRQTETAYGAKLHRLALGIVQNHEDAQECVIDTYLKAWNTIPPQKPKYFFAYLAKICRFAAFGMLDYRNAAKRKAEVLSLTDEMAACIPDRMADRELEGEQIGALLTDFLEKLPRQNRLIFLRRYWFLDSIDQIALRYGVSQSKVKTQLHRTRAKLKDYLEKEGVDL